MTFPKRVSRPAFPNRGARPLSRAERPQRRRSREPLGRPLRRPRRQAISFPRYDRRRCCGRARERIFRCRDSGRGCQRAISRENDHRFSFRYSMIFPWKILMCVCECCVCIHYLNKFIYVAAKFLYPCVCKIVFSCLRIVNPNIARKKRVSRLAGHS